MRGKLSSILVILLALAGIGVLSYPTVSNWLAERNASRVITEYNEEVAQMNAERIAEELEKAKQYNESLAGTIITDPFKEGGNTALSGDYRSVLNITNDGIIGHIEIPEISVHLPIYHGVSETVLQKGVGHMEQTALPIGGEGNHPVLTAHTGLSHAKLFTDLVNVKLEDVFYIKVLNETYAYQVDQILVIEPSDTKDLRPVAGEDYVSLITCTPYGINSHRLVVRGTRIPYVEPVEQIDDTTAINWRLVMIVAFVVIVAISYAVSKYRQKRRNNNLSQEAQEMGRKKTKRKKRKWLRVLAVLVFLVGGTVALFPYISQLLYQQEADGIITEFDEGMALARASDDNFNAFYQSIVDYNAGLNNEAQDGIVDAFSDEEGSAEYDFDADMFGYLSIPKMNIRLPLYLGATEENLRRGAAHITGTSLPVGGNSTNSGIAAHRGMGTKAMFRNIQRLEYGDMVYLTNAWGTLTYKVVETAIISPLEVEKLQIQEGRDLITLVTCHPYRQNYQRYLVYAERVE